MSGAKYLAEMIERVVDEKITKAMRGGVQTVDGEYVGTDSEGKSWVMLPGADAATPVKTMAVEAKAGDIVSVTIGNGRATVSANVSNPGAGVAGVSEVRETATVAKDTADEATVSASQALNAAATAQDSADRALVSADSAAEAAAMADTHAEEAMQSATVAGDAAGRAQASASIANDAANAAIADAAIANRAANEANVAANGAVRGLATVEDVIGTLNWIAEHGTYVQTQDAHIDPAKVYYTRSGSGTQQDPYVYAAVEEPTDAGLSSYYELSIDSGIANYVNTHLALMDDGLHVVPTSGGYYLVIANDGVSVYDSQSNLVTKFGESIDFASTRPQKIGNDSTYVRFYDSDNDGIADRIEIAADSVSIGTTDVSTALSNKANSSDVYTKTEADFNVSLGGISSNVSEIVDGLSQSSHFQQDGDSFTFSIDSAIEEAAKTATEYLRMTEEGLTLANSDSEIRQVMSNTKNAFKTDAGDIAWFGLNDDGGWEMHVEVTNVENMMRFGDYAWIKRANGNMTLKWLGE